MKVDTAIKSYVLYTSLLITLSATVYFAYQDYIKIDSSDKPKSIYVVKDIRKSYALTLSKDLFGANESVLNVDIFATHKPIELKPEIKAVESNTITVVSPQAPALLTPVLPSLPFKYIGKIFGDDEFQVFIAFNGKSLIVKEGDIVQQIYKIEKISPPNMNITYMPSNTPLTMQIGEPN